MSRGEAIYNSLPVFAQNWACSLEGWRINRSRYDRTFSRVLDEASARANWSVEQIYEWRDARLKAFLKDAVRSVPYYREQTKLGKFDIDGVTGLDDLSKLPILEKRVVQSRNSDFEAELNSREPAQIAHTSGTTGGGLRFPVTRSSRIEQWAVWWRYRHWHKIERAEWCAYFGGRTIVPPEIQTAPFWRINVPGRQIMFSAYHLREESAVAYLSEIKRRGIRWLHGYPSQLALLAKLAYANSFDLRGQLRWITIGAESLLAQQAAVIEKAFGRAPIQHYGMAEGVANISERPDGVMVVDEDFAAVEFVPLLSGGWKILGTNFSNAAFPLIRYEVGDIADLTPGETASEKGALAGCRVVRDIDGRREDYVILKNGAKVGRLDHIFKDLVEVREAQIIQDRIGAITVRLVTGDRFDEAVENRLRDEIADRLGSDFVVDVHYVDELPRTKRGKFRFVISNLDQGRIVI